MKLEIKFQTPNIEDIAQVVADTKDFPFLTYVEPRSWRSFDGYYVAYEDNVFAGVLAVNRFGGWSKLGPLAVLSKFHGKGVATALVKQAILSEKKNIYLSSANPNVWKITERLGFIERYSWWNLPLAIRICYLKISMIALFHGAMVSYVKEAWRKQKLADIHHHRHFVKEN